VLCTKGLMGWYKFENSAMFHCVQVLALTDSIPWSTTEPPTRSFHIIQLQSIIWNLKMQVKLLPASQS
jgi:hypothetical protein